MGRVRDLTLRDLTFGVCGSGGWKCRFGCIGTFWFRTVVNLGVLTRKITAYTLVALYGAQYLIDFENLKFIRLPF